MIRVFYFILGGLAPIAMQVLQVINRRCIEISAMLKWYFRWAPVFNVNHGYLNIVNREILAYRMNERPEEYTPLSDMVAGENLTMMYYMFVISWVVVILAENGFFTFVATPVILPLKWILHKLTKCCSCKRSQTEEYKVADEEDTTKAILKIDDRDPYGEAQRIKRIDPKKLSIKVQNLSKTYDFDTKAVNELNFGLVPGECFALLGVTGAGKTSTFKCLTGEIKPDGGQLHIGGNDVLSLFEQD